MIAKSLPENEIQNSNLAKRPTPENIARSEKPSPFFNGSTTGLATKDIRIPAKLLVVYFVFFVLCGSFTDIGKGIVIVTELDSAKCAQIRDNISTTCIICEFAIFKYDTGF